MGRFAGGYETAVREREAHPLTCKPKSFPSFMTSTTDIHIYYNPAYATDIAVD